MDKSWEPMDEMMQKQKKGSIEARLD